MQLHVALFVPSTQVPPFWQVTDEQSSETKSRNKDIENIQVVSKNNVHVQDRLGYLDHYNFQKLKLSCSPKDSKIEGVKVLLSGLILAKKGCPFKFTSSSFHVMDQLSEMCTE